MTGFLCGELRVPTAVADRAALGEVLETEDTLSALLPADAVPVTLNVRIRRLGLAGVKVLVRRGSLGDVFLYHTGRTLVD